MVNRESIDNLRLIYDEVEEIPNDLIMVMRETRSKPRNSVAIISNEETICRFTCDSVEIIDRFVVGTVKILNFKYVSVFDTLTKTSISNTLRGIAEESSITDFKCSDGMIRVQIGAFVSVKWVILNNQCKVINKEFHNIEDIREDDKYFYFTGYKSFRDQYRVFGEKRVKMDKQTGEILSMRTINMFKHFIQTLIPYKEGEIRR